MAKRVKRALLKGAQRARRLRAMILEEIAGQGATSRKMRQHSMPTVAPLKFFS
jgi:hypothetical protein